MKSLEPNKINIFTPLFNSIIHINLFHNYTQTTINNKPTNVLSQIQVFFAVLFFGGLLCFLFLSFYLQAEGESTVAKSYLDPVLFFF